MLTPNVNTVYGFGFMDLGSEPIVLTIPNSHGRYYVVEILGAGEQSRKLRERRIRRTRTQRAPAKR